MEEKWKQDIKFYDLTGLHVLVTEEFHSDLYENYGVNMIPKYFILDETGKLAEASRPSHIEKLQKMLE